MGGDEPAHPCTGHVATRSGTDPRPDETWTVSGGGGDTRPR